MMGYEYGIKIARDAVINLVRQGSTFTERLANAFSEITVIEDNDVSEEHYAEIQSLYNEYLNMFNATVNREGIIEKPDGLQTVQVLSDKLIWLAFDICKSNTILSSRETEH